MNLEPNFPYKLLSRNQIIDQFNSFATQGIPFLFIIDYKAASGFVIKISDIDDEFLCISINSKLSENEFHSEKVNDIIKWEVQPNSISDYKLKFDYVIAQIRKGNSFLTNLTQPSQVTTTLQLRNIYNISNSKYKLWIKDHFVVFSPETFVQIKNGKISSFPMKGTIDASLINAEETIINNIKEKAEHATIVDLIRNDLSIVANNVEVKRFRYIDKIITNKGEILQVSSEISGDLPQNYFQNLGDIIFSLLPAGSICGAPKAKTLEIIETAEEYNRGFYTGIFGVFDGNNLDSAVTIRFLEQQGDNFVFKSGGGITSQSIMENEYNELIQKVYVPFY